MTARAAWPALALAAVACVLPRVTAEHVLTGPAGSPRAGPVTVVMEGVEPPAAYEEVAIVSATGSGGAATLEEVIGALQGEAAHLGCDAVIRVRYDRGASTATATGVAVRLR